MIDNIIDNIEDLDIKPIEDLLSELASTALTGETVYIEETVNISLPEQILSIVEYIASKTEYTKNQVLSKLCSINLKNEVDEIRRLSKENIPEAPKLADLSALDGLGKQIKSMESITGQFEQMKQGIEALSKLAEMMEKKK